MVLISACQGLIGNMAANPLPAVTNQYRSEQSRNSIILSFIRPLTSKKWVAGCPICIQAAVQTTIVGLNTLTNYPAGRQNIPAEIIN